MVIPSEVEGSRETCFRFEVPGWDHSPNRSRILNPNSRILLSPSRIRILRILLHLLDEGIEMLDVAGGIDAGFFGSAFD